MPRPSGSPNKCKGALKRRLKELLGDDFDPVVSMAEMAIKVHESALASGDIADQKESVNCWDKVAQYIEPKLKAVEITGEDGGAVRLDTVWRVELVSSKEKD